MTEKEAIIKTLENIDKLTSIISKLIDRTEKIERVVDDLQRKISK